MVFSMEYNSLKLCLLLLLIGLSKAISLDESGNYDLVVAIDETTAQNSIPNYIDNIKRGIQDLSELLNYTTKGTFSIRTASILVPTHWNVPNIQPATSEFFDGADLKISHLHLRPYVHNPNPCGQSGENMLLPYNFFDTNYTGDYGRIGKALLTQFVRLRYGAWEEHGYPEDPRFPYYWKPLNGDEWEVNACTDAPITGTYKDINDGLECGTDPANDLYPPSSSCRFFPDATQAAKSSIMSYHYLKTVDEFCTSENHNKETPSSQNFFCRYKSVMEVIETSPDWKQVTAKNNGSAVEFKVVKNARSPLFYILLDGGKSQAPVSVLSGISSSLKTLVGDVELRNLVAGVGAFPGPSASKSYTSIAPWSHLRSNSAVIINAFDVAFGSTVGFRNYPAALKDIADEIKFMNHKEGAAVLVVKTGEESNPGLTPENEVIASVLSAKIKVFAIEIQGNSLQSAIALQNLVSKSGGTHLTIARANDVTGPLTEFMTTLKNILKSEIHPDSNYIRAVYEVVPLGGKISLPFDVIREWKCYLVPLSGEISNPVLDPGTVNEVQMSERTDWGQSEQGSKKAYFYEYDYPNEALFWDEFSYSCDKPPCEVLVAIFAVVDNPPLEDNIHLSVSTSAVNDVVDMTFAGPATDLGVPFAIYARLDEEEIPLKADENLKLTATVYRSDYSSVTTIELKDDGTGVPDVSTNDGIFSGTFVPSANGIYKIMVTASYRIPPATTPPETTEIPNFKRSTSRRKARSVGKLLPVDQQNIGCGSEYQGCWSKSPEIEFEKTQQLKGAVEFKNVENYKNNLYGWRITDLQITPLDDFTVKLKWTDPGVHMASVPIRFDAYVIAHSEDFNMVLNDYINCEKADTKYLQPQDPGAKREYEFRLGRDAKRYFAIRTLLYPPYGNNDAGQVTPVIVGVEFGEFPVSTTTTTTTTTRPTTSSTTTMPTIITESTILEEQTTTVGNTRTTPARSTTPRPTTVLTTTLKTTTRAPSLTTEEPVKHWFEEKEGIITLSVFGGAVVLLLAGGLVYVWITRYR